MPMNRYAAQDMNAFTVQPRSTTWQATFQNHTVHSARSRIPFTHALSCVSCPVLQQLLLPLDKLGMSSGFLTSTHMSS